MCLFHTILKCSRMNTIEQKLESDGLVILKNLSQDSWDEFNSIIQDELSLILK